MEKGEYEALMKKWEQEFQLERWREPSQDKDFVRNAVRKFLQMREIDPDALLELLRLAAEKGSSDKMGA